MRQAKSYEVKTNSLTRPKQIMWGISPRELTEETDRHLYRIVRIAAMKQITKYLLKINPPSFNNWKLALNNMVEIERITYKIRDQEPDYLKQWNRWFE